MIKLFKKPLLQNDKVDRSELVDYSMSVADHHNEQADAVSKTPLWDQLRVATRDSRTNTTSKRNDPMVAAPTTRTSVRAARSTRSTLPSYDLEEPISEKQVEKFSIVVGLGTPWSR